MLINVEKEKLVIDLYYNQLKNVRQIAQEARISFRDIAAILKKKEAAVNDSSGIGNGIVLVDKQQQSDDSNNKSPNENEKATKAYKLYDEGKKPVEVAIELGLSEKEATRYYKEYWRLNHLYKLYQVWMEIADCLPSFLKSYKVFKRKGLTADNVEWFANAIESGTIKLPELQHEYKNLENKVQTMQYQKQKLERDLQVIQKQVTELTEVENMHQHNIDTLQNSKAQNV
jgi:hypothetical protein